MSEGDINVLTENGVVENVCNYLRENGYQINQALNTEQHGIDIVANSDNLTLKIEAKGATSSKIDTSRFGKGFNRNQVKTHISVALYAISKLISDEIETNNVKYSFALPDDKNHRSIIEGIEKVLGILNISVFWVKENGIVVEQKFQT